MSVSKALRGTQILERISYGYQLGARRSTPTCCIRALRLQGSPVRWALPRRAGASTPPATRAFRTSCVRRMATVEAVSNGMALHQGSAGSSPSNAMKTEKPYEYGPIDEYNARVEAGRLRDDEHQRGTRPSCPEPAP